MKMCKKSTRRPCGPAIAIAYMRIAGPEPNQEHIKSKKVDITVKKNQKKTPRPSEPTNVSETDSPAEVAREVRSRTAKRNAANRAHLAQKACFDWEPKVSIWPVSSVVSSAISSYNENRDADACVSLSSDDPDVLRRIRRITIEFIRRELTDHDVFDESLKGKPGAQENRRFVVEPRLKAAIAKAYPDLDDYLCPPTDATAKPVPPEEEAREECIG